MLCVLLIAILSFWSTANAAVSCNATHNPCEEILWKGSKCRDGFCTNPFQGGCLRTLLASEEYEEKYSDKSADNTGGDSSTTRSLQAIRRRLLSTARVCNSEDAPDAAEHGICIENTNDSAEVRISTRNWEPAFVVSWIMQIIYSELVGVPSTIESEMAYKNINFYDETNRMQYGSSDSIKIIQNAYDAEGGDCSKNNKNTDGDDDDYIPCVHVHRIKENKNPMLRMSPAYDIYKEFAISDLQIDEIFREWSARGVDSNFDMRYATCKWIADNLDYVVHLIPPSHPRTSVYSKLLQFLLPRFEYFFNEAKDKE